MTVDEDFMHDAVMALKHISSMHESSNDATTDALLLPAVGIIADAIENEIDNCTRIEKESE